MSCKNNQYCKSTLSAYTDATVTLEQGDLMPINTNQSLTGTSITHTAGSKTISIVKPGIYVIGFSATNTQGATAGAVSLQIYRNGVPYPSGLVTRTPTATTDIENVSTITTINVREICPCAGTGTPSIDLTFVNTGVQGVYSYFNVTIFKIA